MAVDSFKFLPRILATFYQMTGQEPELPIPWAPLSRPPAGCKFGLITSGGLYQRGVEAPFDLEREREEPTWGDPPGVAGARDGRGSRHDRSLYGELARAGQRGHRGVAAERAIAGGPGDGAPGARDDAAKTAAQKIKRPGEHALMGLVRSCRA